MYCIEKTTKSKLTLAQFDHPCNDDDKKCQDLGIGENILHPGAPLYICCINECKQTCTSQTNNYKWWAIKHAVRNPKGHQFLWLDKGLRISMCSRWKGVRNVQMVSSRRRSLAEQEEQVLGRQTYKWPNNCYIRPIYKPKENVLQWYVYYFVRETSKWG